MYVFEVKVSFTLFFICFFFLNLYNVLMRCTWYLYMFFSCCFWLQKPCLMLSLYLTHFVKCAVWLLFVSFFVSKWIHAFMEYNLKKKRVSKAKLLFFSILDAGQNVLGFIYCWKSTETFKVIIQKRVFLLKRWKWELEFLWFDVSYVRNFSHKTFSLYPTHSLTVIGYGHYWLDGKAFSSKLKVRLSFSHGESIKCHAMWYFCLMTIVLVFQHQHLSKSYQIDWHLYTSASKTDAVVCSNIFQFHNWKHNFGPPKCGSLGWLFEWQEVFSICALSPSLSLYYFIDISIVYASLHSLITLLNIQQPLATAQMHLSVSYASYAYYLYSHR